MKQILLIAISFVVLSLVTHARAAETGTAMKLEGTCTGNLADGTTVSLNYYSDYNGCKDVNKSAVTFTSGIEGLFTGERSLGKKDVYTYPQHRLTFANSTGNTEGTLLYTDAQGARQSVKLLCDVRDYEYAEAC